MMEEPTPCPECGEIVELQDMRKCFGCGELFCRECLKTWGGEKFCGGCHLDMEASEQQR